MLILFTIVFILIIATFYHFFKDNKPRYMSISLYRSTDINIFYSYVQYHISGDEVNLGLIQTRIGNIFHEQKDQVYISYNVTNKTYFKDLNLGIEGYFISKKLKHGTGYCTTVDSLAGAYCVKIYILKTSKDMDPYKIFLEIMRHNMYVQSPRLRYHIHRNEMLEMYKIRILTNNTKTYMDSFFNKEKDQLWEFIKNGLKYDVSIKPNMNILLYGPPGSGKSSFIYKVAISLGYDVCDIDLCSYDKIKYRDVICKYKYDQHIIHTLTTYYDFDNSIKKIVNKQNKSDLDIDYIIELCKENILYVPHLSISVVDNLDEIKIICPELFYPGRFTVVHFNYVDIDTLQDICMFYFNKKIKKRVPETIMIPTSAIIQLALESKTFDLFELNLLKMM